MSSPTSPSLGLFSTLRLGLFQGCLGCLAVIFAGLLNRIMLTELAFPGLLVGGALAFEQFAAPARVLVGQISDAYPLAGRRRVPYVLLGTLLFSGLAVLVVPLIFRVRAVLNEDTRLESVFAMAALCGLFALYGLAVSLASTPYLALVIDRTTESERPRAVGIIWSMLTVGIVIGAIAIQISLRSLDGVRDLELLRDGLQLFMFRVAAVVMALTVVATWGMENRQGEHRLDPSFSPSAPTQDREDHIGLRQSWLLITSSRQVGVFFAFLVLFTLALFLQDPVLESFGAQVFAMPIAATAMLNAYWGMGTLVGLLLAGLWIVPRIGKLASARLGCQLIALALLALLLSGLSGWVALLQAVLFGFGLAAGIGTNSALCLMLDLTLPQAAGTFVGVWGLAQALSRALGKLLGGALYDVGRLLPLPGGSFPAFALVFVVELIVALVALHMLSQLNLRQFREDTGRSLDRVLAVEIG
ncbi:MAG: BCD family MFS transporter [Synechococcaceae cyanobacterium]|nr:BCD family MFS transporter [Synechococcaceae cyanobacterium]